MYINIYNKSAYIIEKWFWRLTWHSFVKTKDNSVNLTLLATAWTGHR